MPATVLVVDREQEVRELCAEALAARGYQVRQAPSAEEARAQLDAGGVDIVLTDLMLPGQHGSGLDVILMAAQANLATAVEALKLGAYDYIAKPFGIAELLYRIDRLAERRELIIDNQVLRLYLATGGGPGGLIGTTAE